MVLVWYPKCSTCQRAKAWLDEHGVTYTLRDIKEENPNAVTFARYTRYGASKSWAAIRSL